MRNILTKGLLITSLLLTTSCIKDSFDYEDCLYKLRVELDFINTTPLDEKEQLKLVVSSATNPQRARTDLVTDIHGRDLELEPDLYHFVVFEPAENISVVDNTLTVSTNADGTAKQPTKFSGGSAVAEVKENIAFQLLHVPLHLQCRELIVQIKFTGVGVPYIKDIKGGLDGIAISREINNGFEPVGRQRRPPAIKAGSINYVFLPKERAPQEFTGSNVLLGIDGRINQTLRLSANTTLGIVKDYELNASEHLDEFHTKNVHEPWYIVLELALDAKLEMTIEDWYTGPESELIAQ